MSEITIDLGQLQNSCFIVMPFDSLYQTEYEKVIQPALEDLKITCIRGDEIYTKQRIMDDIWSAIRSCRFVVAELTGRNPNVLYEVGLAHAIGKPVIILTRNADDVPFDLKDLRYLYYNTDNPFWGESLKIALKELITKVIENPTIESYLQRITKVSKNDFPKLADKNTSNKIEQVPFDISGTWLGKFDVNGNHEIILEINQKNLELFATAVITFDISNDPSIVQQNMTGTIEKDKVILTGVNYTFVKRGDGGDYNMDNFNLKYNEQDNSMVGNVIDGEEESGPITLKRKV